MLVVSTLLEILPHPRILILAHVSPRRVSTLLEILHARRDAEFLYVHRTLFQPFLRFYARGADAAVRGQRSGQGFNPS